MSATFSTKCRTHVCGNEPGTKKGAIEGESNGLSCSGDTHMRQTCVLPIEASLCVSRFVWHFHLLYYNNFSVSRLDILAALIFCYGGLFCVLQRG